ncbi:MAG: acylglycerol kinase family protein [Myxococcales bacterium]|nr:acylglycerol kinase family protein [Myxococcales bacterium]
MQVALLNNLRAGRSKRQVARMLALLSDHPDTLHVETGSTGVLPEAIADLARNRVDLLIINGGDGTLQHALTEILERRPFDRLPLIAPLRGGRTNMTALDFGARRDPVRGVADLLQAVQQGTLAERLVKRPLLRVESRTRRDVQYGMFFGAGMIRRAIGLTHRSFPSGLNHGVFGPGLVTAGLALRAVFQGRDGILAPDKAQVYLDGKMVPHGEFMLLIASSLDRLFMRMNPFWGKESGGVRFTSIAHKAARKATSFPAIMAGRPGRGVTPEAGYTSRNVEQAELYFDCGYTIDGEIFGAVSDESVTLSADRRITFVRA